MAIEEGYTAQDIIEPVDGFHPSQLANFYLAEVFWANIQRDRPEWIPLPNPNNNIIDALFGNPILSKTSEFWWIWKNQKSLMFKDFTKKKHSNKY